MVEDQLDNDVDEIIDDLSKDDYNKLIERLEENPELKEILTVDIVDA